MTRPSNPEGEAVTDSDLVQVLREDADPHRRREAATELLMRHRDAVYAWCFRYTRDHDRALDMSQDVMVTAWQRIGEFGGRSRFSSWLFSVTRNRCIDASRRTRIMAEDPILDDPTDAAPGPADALLATEREHVLMELIRTELDALEQDAVYLRYFECLSVEAIGEFLRVEGVSGARAVLQRARRKLRTAAKKRFPDGSDAL